jgi:hypothetical protein
LTYASRAGIVIDSTILVFALIVLLLSPVINLQAQIAKASQAQTRPVAADRLTPRQQRNLIRYNEAGAIRTLQTLLSSEATYQSTTGNGDYGTIEELGKEKLIDYVLAEGHRYGYLFRVKREKFSPESPASFEIVAVPRTYMRTGRRSFYMNETGVIHAANKKGAEANPSDDIMVIDP